MRYKFRVKSKEHSRSIQEYFFNLGCKWASDTTDSINLDMPHIYVNTTSGIITYWTGEEYFNNHDFIESELRTVTSTEVVKVVPPRSVIALQGNYTKSELRDILEKEDLFFEENS